MDMPGNIEHLTGGHPPFTSETARMAAAKSAEVRKAKRAAREAQQEAALLALEAVSGLKPEQPGFGVSNYRDERLKRIRAQLDRIDAMMMKTSNPIALDKLASASARLNEQEAQLSMRAKPAPVKQGKGTSNAPQMAEPSID